MYLGLLITTAKAINRKSGIILNFFANKTLIFTKHVKFLGSRIYGVISKELEFKIKYNKRIKYDFKEVTILAKFII